MNFLRDLLEVTRCETGPLRMGKVLSSIDKVSIFRVSTRFGLKFRFDIGSLIAR